MRIEGIPSPFAWLYSIFVGKREIVREIYRSIAEEVVSKISSGRVLDVGTGPGFLPVEIAKKVPEIEVIGIDISGGMVKIANKSAEKMGFSGRVRFIEASASSMPFEDEYFDLVVSTFSLHHWAEPEECLKEIVRVLKKGGEAWIYDIRRDVPLEANSQFRKKYGFFFYILLQLIKIHSSVSMKKVESILRKGVGFSEGFIEDLGIMIKIKIIK